LLDELSEVTTFDELAPLSARARQLFAACCRELLAQDGAEPGPRTCVLVREIGQRATLLDGGPLTWYELGQASFSLGAWAMADEAFESALARDPKHVPSLLGKGKAALARENWCEARLAFSRACSLAPDNVEATAGLQTARSRFRFALAELAVIQQAAGFSLAPELPVSRRAAPSGADATGLANPAPARGGLAAGLFRRLIALASLPFRRMWSPNLTHRLGRLVDNDRERCQARDHCR
jgi:tetratricopeptide (TPR) repeat protein